jgi:flagellar motor switch protein FliG
MELATIDRSSLPVRVQPAPPPAYTTGRPQVILNRRQKAAVVVRLLIAEGASLPIGDLPEALQAELTSQMAQMRYIDRATLRAVIEEFATELESIGLSFPGGLEGALRLLEGTISPDMAARLRRQSGMAWFDDPWETIATMDADKLLPLLHRESPEVGAVILSKLKVAQAADLLGRLPGATARRLTLAVSETADIAPDTVRRIGVTLAADLDARPPRAFSMGAVDRVGAILNISTSDTRDDLLAGLDDEDADFATLVRRAIFTFADIPGRVAARDVAGVLRAVSPEDLQCVIAGAGEGGDPSVEFILANMSKRMAEQLREGAADIDTPSPKQLEAAQTAVIAAIRAAIDAGTIKLIDPEAEG